MRTVHVHSFTITDGVVSEGDEVGLHYSCDPEYVDIKLFGPGILAVIGMAKRVLDYFAHAFGSVEPSDRMFHPGIWYLTATESPKDTFFQTFRLEGFTEAEEAAIFDALEQT